MAVHGYDAIGYLIVMAILMSGVFIKRKNQMKLIKTITAVVILIGFIAICNL
jgi:hypothetical protein